MVPDYVLKRYASLILSQSKQHILEAISTPEGRNLVIDMLIVDSDLVANYQDLFWQYAGELPEHEYWYAKYFIIGEGCEVDVLAYREIGKESWGYYGFGENPLSGVSRSLNLIEKLNIEMLEK